jgi:hypothetical protein
VQAVVFPSQMSLLIQIQPDQRNKIRPPLLTLKYSALSANPQSPSVPASFSVTYTNPPELTGTWHAMVAHCLSLSFITTGVTHQWLFDRSQ